MISKVFAFLFCFVLLCNYSYQQTTGEVTTSDVTTNALFTIQMKFEDDWSTYLTMTSGIKGKIYRSFLSKNALDEQNIQYGAARSNLTDCAEMGFNLGNVATNLTTFQGLISNFATVFYAAIVDG